MTAISSDQIQGMPEQARRVQSLLTFVLRHQLNERPRRKSTMVDKKVPVTTMIVAVSV